MIANDIIDLTFSSQHSRVDTERYWNKILSTEEKSWLDHQVEKLPSILKIWAIKETAYKLVRKLEYPHSFIPKKITISNLEKIKYYDSKCIYCKTPMGTFPIKVRVYENKIEAWGSTDLLQLAQMSSKSFTLTQTDYSYQSKQTHQTFLQDVASAFSLEKEKLTIQKENFIPTLYLSNKKVPLDISFSHHGNWASYVYALKRPLC